MLWYEKAPGPCANKISPQKSLSGTIRTDRGRHRKVAEYFQEFHSRENVDTDTAVISTTNLPNIAELDSSSSVKEHR